MVAYHPKKNKNPFHIFDRNTLGFFSLLLLLLILPVTILLEGHQQVTEQNAATSGSLPQTVGKSIVDENAKLLVLRGAQIPSAFNNISNWQLGQYPTERTGPHASYTTPMDDKTFTQMHTNWYMNEFRLPVSNWEFTADGCSDQKPYNFSCNYMNLVDTAVQRANAQGLYVLLANFDDGASGSPYADTDPMPKAETVDFWKAMAVHFKANLKIFYDPFNEPQYPTWQMWHDGGTTTATLNGKKVNVAVIGTQQLINAIRSVDNHIIVVQPMQTGHQGWAGSSAYPLSGGNLIYSLHTYDELQDGQALWDTMWDWVAGSSPQLYGEWGFLPNSQYPYFCEQANNSTAVATGFVTAFLGYIDTKNISSNAWQFNSYHMIQDYTVYTPTNLDGGGTKWNCTKTGVDKTSQSGMGAVVKQHYQATQNLSH